MGGMSLDGRWCGVVASRENSAHQHPSHNSTIYPDILFTCFGKIFCLLLHQQLKKNIMNNSNGWKTDHSACILEEQRLHVYRWMLREILKGNTVGEFLCHLLDDYNYRYQTNYKLEQFPELVMQRQSTVSWWGGGV